MNVRVIRIDTLGMATPENRQGNMLGGFVHCLRFCVPVVGTLWLGVCSGVSATRIGDDFGGRIGTYVERYDKLRTSEQTIIVDGDCFSACTLVLGMIPKSRLCLTERARFGFHSAWKPGVFGFRIQNEDGTRVMWDLYPRDIQEWIRRSGGLSDQVLYLTANDLKGEYRICR